MRASFVRMFYVVFSRGEGGIPVPAIAGQASRHFGMTVEIAGEGSTDAKEGSNAEVRLRISTPKDRGEFLLRARLPTPDDIDRARSAEGRGRAGGMADLAARCGMVWCVESEGLPERFVLEVCALFASVALGPILPPDGSALLGVRSARERAERLGTSP